MILMFVSASVREPAPESSEVTVPIDGKPADDEKISGVGAFDEIVKELEQSDRSASETSVPAEEKVEEAPKVKSRVDRIETVPLRGASVKLQMPFNRALQSSDSVPLPQPKTTVSRRPKVKISLSFLYWRDTYMHGMIVMRFAGRVISI